MKFHKTGYYVFDRNGWVRSWAKSLPEANASALALGEYMEIRKANSVVVLRHGRDLLKLSHIRLDIPQIVY